MPFLGNRPESAPAVDVDQEEYYLPVISVAARPWTQLTNDDALVSHLVTLFFTWEQPWYNFIEMTAFLNDMQAAQDDDTWTKSPPEKEYCSPALVNAIMALGAVSILEYVRLAGCPVADTLS